MYDETYITEHVLKSCLKICLIDLSTEKEKANYVIINVSNFCYIMLHFICFDKITAFTVNKCL